MCLITSLVIMAINSNLILSLGMVGALNIVRFRTPIKDPTDLIFLSWSAAAGIVTGAGFYTLAILGSVVIGLVLFIFIKKSAFDTPYLLDSRFEARFQSQAELISPYVERDPTKFYTYEEYRASLNQDVQNIRGCCLLRRLASPMCCSSLPAWEVSAKLTKNPRCKKEPGSVSIPGTSFSGKVKLRYSASASLPAHEGNGG